MTTRSLRRVTEGELYALCDAHDIPRSRISHDGAGERSLWHDGVLYVTTDQEHTS